MEISDYKFISYEEVFNAYMDCRRYKSMTVQACNFENNLYKNLYCLWEELDNEVYNVGQSYVFVVTKPVLREVFAAQFRDRIVHHVVINRIMPHFEKKMIPNSFSCRIGKGTLCAIKTLEYESKLITENFTKTAYGFKGDFTSFFMTINKALLYQKICDLIRTDVHPGDEKQADFLCNLVNLIIENEPQVGCIYKQPKKMWRNLPKKKSLFNTPSGYGLPIGNLTSQIFANYYLSEFDHFIYDELGFKYYGRYVDDFYILSESKEKLIKTIPLLEEKLSEIGVTLHPKKRYLQELSKGMKFVGGVVKPHRTYIAKRTVGNWKSMIYEMSNYLQTIDVKDLSKAEVAHFVSSFNSYLGFLRHHNTFKIRKKICNHKLMEPFLKICYFNENYTKMIPYKEWGITGKGINFANTVDYYF